MLIYYGYYWHASPEVMCLTWWMKIAVTGDDILAALSDVNMVL